MAVIQYITGFCASTKALHHSCQVAQVVNAVCYVCGLNLMHGPLVTSILIVKGCIGHGSFNLEVSVELKYVIYLI